MPAVAIRCQADPVLDAVAPIVLAAAHRRAVVVDGGGLIPLPGRRTLAELVSDGVRLADLSPDRDGVAVLPNGGTSVEEAADVIAALADRWPLVVLRGPAPGFPTIPVVPLFPGVAQRDPAAYVATGLVEPDAGLEPVVRAPSRSAVARILAGGSAPRRLVGNWAKVWSHSWR
jgi:hypothetical protein